VDHLGPKSKNAADRERTLLSEIVRLLARQAAREWLDAAQEAEIPHPDPSSEEPRK
jgi:hypothetical protein